MTLISSCDGRIRHLLRLQVAIVQAVARVNSALAGEGLDVEGGEVEEDEGDY